MEADELHRALEALLEKGAQLSTERSTADAAAKLLGTLDLLIEILAAKGAINDGHRRLLAKVRERAKAERPRVFLRTVDARMERVTPVDCETRLHLCRARCCSFGVRLSREEVEAGRLLWNIEEPYLLRREADARCSHLDRATLGCGVYSDRPGPCRVYDCRNDQRVWIDFDARIPAPMPIP